MENKETDFIARHYRHGLFNADRALQALGIRRAGWLHRWHTAAAVAFIAVAGAVAAVVISTRSDQNAAPKTEAEKSIDVPAAHQSPSPGAEIIVLDFDDAPLTEIVAQIESSYGVTIQGIPANASEIRLTLHFEGNVDDLIATINAMLDTEMTVITK